MLPRRYRLKREEFRRVLRSGIFIKGRFVSLKKLKNSLSYTRAGFVVGQKIAKKAVQRNKIRRALREAAKDYILIAQKRFDIVFLPTPDIKNKKNQEIKEELRLLLKKTDAI